MAQHTTQLIDQTEVAEGTTSFTFTKPEGFVYKAGQFVSLELPNDGKAKGSKLSRTFTLASAPHEKHLMIATRMRDSDFKEALADLERGAEVDVKGPNGKLTWPSEKKGSIAFIAGGIGITPFLSMLRQARYEDATGRVTLFYSNHRPEDAAFLDEMQEIAQSTENCRIVNTMTAMEHSESRWDGETGHVDGAMLKRYVDNLNEPVYYVAGPPDMVTAMDNMLQGAGVAKEHIKTEQFSGY